MYLINSLNVICIYLIVSSIRNTALAEKQSDEYLNTHEYTSYYSESAGRDEHDDYEEREKWLPSKGDQPVKKFIKQPLDHFNKDLVKRWRMTVLENAEFWKDGAPIYLFIRGNAPVKFKEIKEGFMYELAKTTGGIMFSAEHRYYGKRDPHKDLRYLTSSQAVEDLNNLIKRLKREKVYAKSKVVLVGGGYGGSLAVWLKQAYPGAADVVVASSAPLQAKLDFKEYFMYAANAFKRHMPHACTDKIKDQLYTYDFCVNKSQSSTHDCLRNHFPFLELCQTSDMALPENRHLFFLSELSVYADAAVRGLRQMFRTCKNLRMNTRVREFSLFWDKQNACYDYDFSRFISNVKDKPENRNIKRWLYQCCNEFGLFPTTAAYPSPFKYHVPIRFYYHVCAELFGIHFDEYKIGESIKQTNERYGGLTPNVRNVIFTFGRLDPWQHVGVTDRFAAGSEVLLIPGVSHCKDLEPKSSNDTVALRKARTQMKNFVTKVISVKPIWGQ